MLPLIHFLSIIVCHKNLFICCCCLLLHISSYSSFLFNRSLKLFTFSSSTRAPVSIVCYLFLKQKGCCCCSVLFCFFFCVSLPYCVGMPFAIHMHTKKIIFDQKYWCIRPSFIVMSAVSVKSSLYRMYHL